AVRGGGYLDRWALMELAGATSYTAAHTAGSYTNGLLPNQVTINTGENRADGATAVWTDIDPGPDGIIAIVSRQYTGPLPGGGTGSTGLYRSEEHTSELQSRENLVCRLLLEK